MIRIVMLVGIVNKNASMMVYFALGAPRVGLRRPSPGHSRSQHCALRSGRS